MLYAPGEYRFMATGEVHQSDQDLSVLELEALNCIHSENCGIDLLELG